MKTRISYTLLGAAALLLTQCTEPESVQLNPSQESLAARDAVTGSANGEADKLESLDDLYKITARKAESFNLYGEQGRRIQTQQGTMLDIPPMAFLNAQGQPVGGPITVQITDFYRDGDMALSGVNTQTGGGMLVSGGSFQLQAFAGGQPLQDNPANQVRAVMPMQTQANGQEAQMQLFRGGADQLDPCARPYWTWERGQGQLGVNPGSYQMPDVIPGWSNCDVLYNLANQGTPTQFEACVIGACGAVDIFFFPDAITSVVRLTQQGPNNSPTDVCRMTYTNSVPVGMTGTLLAISVNANNELEFGSLPISVLGNDLFNIPVAPGTVADLQTLVNSL